MRLFPAVSVLVLAGALALGAAPAQAGGSAVHSPVVAHAAPDAADSVLLTRIQHTTRNPAPNPRAETARLRSPAITTTSARQPSTMQPTPPAPAPADTLGPHRR
ncbi:hypothetical protein [Streptomyces sp. RKAG337]|uniref:hypothetical protein n=1 Tax=Streptomyces sp. RKAG337 TaxID=2893404 RepID=UPI002033A38B|nr:hypothetical protein [Streptomyces sp. RKAG337]MCM2427599.1 hypothetical protein [Streptomyces sp. RKAG337]